MSEITNILDIPDFIWKAIEFLFVLLAVLWGIIVKFLLPYIDKLVAALLSLALVIILIIPALIFGGPILILSVLLAIAILCAIILWKLFGKKK